MTAVTRNVYTLFLVLLLAALAGCGGASQLGVPARPQAVTLEDALADLAGLDAPAGVSEGDFNALKGTLKAALESTGESKFVVHPPSGPNSVVTDLTQALLPDGSPGIQWTYVNPGDYNFDGQTNVSDVVQLALYMGNSTQSPTSRPSRRTFWGP
jgi:hypothetical protein